MNLFTELKQTEKSISWKAPTRYWVPREKLWYLNYSLLFLLVMMIAAVLGQYLFILLMLAFGAMWFLQAAIKPSEHIILINDDSIKAFDTVFAWSRIQYFWITRKEGVTYLHIDLGSFRFENINQSQITFIVPESVLESITKKLMKNIEYGLKNEIQYNILAKLLYGQYISLNVLLQDEDNSPKKNL